MLAGAGVVVAAAVESAGERSCLLIAAVTIEMQHLVGPAVLLCGPQHAAQMGKGRRAQHIKGDGFAILWAKAAEQAARHGAKRHIVSGGGAADHQQHAQRASAGAGQGRSAGGGGCAAHKTVRHQGQRFVGAGVAQQLPGNRRRLAHIGHHFHTEILQVLVDLRPDAAAILAGLEQLAEQALADGAHAPFDFGGLARRRVERVLQIVFEVPGQFSLLALIEGKGEAAPCGAAGDIGTLQFHIDLELTIGKALLGQAEDRHSCS
jgi:hypothetical protein